MTPLELPKRVFDQGTTIRIQATVKEQGTGMDPASVLLRVELPDGSQSFPSLVHQGNGVIYGDVTGDTPGQWWVRFESTGPIAAEETRFVVRKSNIL